MAKTVDELPARRGGTSKYPWELWLNGEVWELEEGEDFTQKIQSFRNTAFQRASRDGKKISTRVVQVPEGEEGNAKIYVKAIPSTSSNGKPKTAAKRSRPKKSAAA